MKQITKTYFLKNKDFFLWEMHDWKIFIYPTDTVLGIGCVVSNWNSVEKIFELKQRESKPLLMIIPDLDWVENNALISQKNLQYIWEKLPGAYSFVVNLKNPESINSRIHNNLWSVWIRIPDNWFTQVVSELWESFITTSVNLSWEPSCLNIVEIPQTILDWVDYVIKSDEAFLWKSSTLIDMRDEEMKILRK